MPLSLKCTTNIHLSPCTYTGNFTSTVSSSLRLLLGVNKWQGSHEKTGWWKISKIHKLEVRIVQRALCNSLNATQRIALKQQLSIYEEKTRAFHSTNIFLIALRKQKCTVICLRFPYSKPQIVHFKCQCTIPICFLLFPLSLILVTIFLAETSNILSPLLQTSCPAPHSSWRFNWLYLRSHIKII